MNKYIFIIGTGRTGTTYLRYYFKLNHPGYIVKHQPNRLIKFFSNLYMSNKISSKSMRRYLSFWARSCKKQLKKETPKNVYIQSDPWLYGFTPYLDEFFDNPYVIHLVRNPLTYIPSQLNRSYRNKFMGFLRHKIPYWLLKGKNTGDFSKKSWNKLTEEEKTAWYWVKNNKFIEDNRDMVKNFLRIKNEDLFSNKKTVLKKIADFTDLNLELNNIKEIKRKKDPNFAPKKYLSADEWPPELKHKIELICRPLMVKYGYI